MIKKSHQVIGKTLAFRNACREDAAFILGLRNDPVKSRYLSSTSAQLQDQYSWLETYEKTTDQAYFIIDYKDIPIGTVRLYDQRGKSFCWGSWILSDSRPTHAAMESALMVYSYATTDLGFSAAHFDVRKENEKVWKFHERFGALKVREENDDYYFSINLDAINSSLSKYAKFLSEPVTVIR
jgi:RimJ/RimL family protein N-acetyltransferase